MIIDITTHIKTKWFSVVASIVFLLSVFLCGGFPWARHGPRDGKTLYSYMTPLNMFVDVSMGKPLTTSNFKLLLVFSSRTNCLNVSQL